MDTNSIIIFATAIVIFMILLFAIIRNKRCPREGMEGLSPDASMQKALANGIVINTPSPTSQPATGASQPGNIVVQHDLGEKAMATLEKTNDILAKIDLVNVEEKMRATTESRDGAIDNYNYFKKNGLPLVYYGPGGSNAKVLTHGGKFAIVVVKPNGTTMNFVEKDKSYEGFFEKAVMPKPNSQMPTIPKQLSNISFYDDNGNVAKVYRAQNGEFIVQVDQANGMEVIYTPNNMYTYNTKRSKSFHIGNGNTINDKQSSLKTLELEDGELINNVNNNSIANGLPSSMIPAGEEDKYILKTEIVPPVCPRCPSICSSNADNQEPSCPSCGKSGKGGCSSDVSCPNVSGGPNDNISPNNAYDPVDNSTDKYSQYRHNNKFLPVPMVSDFSNF
jgi:hypothetical protein